MSLRLSLIVLLFIWSAIYLPSLGEPELRGEEIRRILPALAMLETGDWVVPRIAGEIYANKPPLINWAVAGAFALTGSSAEWAARLVSALSVLVLALSALVLLRRYLGRESALLVGLIILTTISFISKGRVIEIEALFVALFGIAVFLWVHLWVGRSSPWLLWTLPYMFIGLGCLAKGPIHLFFWYLFLFAALSCTRSRKSIVHPAHFVGLAVMAMISLPWVFMNLQAVGVGDDSVGNWVAEIAERGNLAKFEWRQWLRNPLKIYGAYLPWAIPLTYLIWALRTGRIQLDRLRREDAVLMAGLITIALGMVAICLLPIGVPRYLMPVYPLAALVTVALYSRLTPLDRERYETFGKRALYLSIPVAIISPTLLLLTLLKRGEAVSFPLFVLGILTVGCVAWLILGPWRERGVFFTTPLLMAAAGIALIPPIDSLRSDRDLFRLTSKEIATLAPADGRIVLFADHHVRNHLPHLLRLIYYIRPPMQGIGEHGSLPLDTQMVLIRPEARAAILEKLGDRVILEEQAILVRETPLTVLKLASPETSQP